MLRMTFITPLLPTSSSQTPIYYEVIILIVPVESGDQRKLRELCMS